MSKEYEVIGANRLVGIQYSSNDLSLLVRMEGIDSPIPLFVKEVNRDDWFIFNSLEKDINNFIAPIEPNLPEGLKDMGVSGWVIPNVYVPLKRMLDSSRFAYIHSMYIGILYKVIFMYDEIAEKSEPDYIIESKEKLFKVLNYISNRDLTCLVNVPLDIITILNENPWINVIAQVYMNLKAFRDDKDLDILFKQYFDSTLIESQITLHNIELSSVTTKYLRRYVSGMYWQVGMMSAILNVPSIELTRSNLELEVLQQLATDYTSLTNDLLSYTREKENNINLNIVSRFSKHKGDAVQGVYNDINRTYSDFCTIASILQKDSRTSPEARKLILLLEGMLGCAHWHFEAPRYCVGSTRAVQEAYVDHTDLINSYL